MEKIIAVTKHTPSEAECQTMKLEGYDLSSNIIILPSFDVTIPARTQLENVGVDTSKPFCMTSPGWFMHKVLLERTPCVYTFIYEPQNGFPLCKGVCRNTIDDFAFIPCPVSLEEQRKALPSAYC